MNNNTTTTLQNGGVQSEGLQQPPFYPPIDMDFYLSRDDRVAIRNKLYGPDIPGKSLLQIAHLMPSFVSLCALISLRTIGDRTSIIAVLDQLLAHLQHNTETRLDDLTISVQDENIKPTTVWRVLTSLIGLSASLPPPTGDVRAHVQALFSCDDAHDDEESFSFGLMDLETAGIEIVPTANVTEHLALDGNTVKILQIDGQRARFFDSFHDNQLANALGLSLLGHEIFASIWALLHKDVHMIPVAEELGFIKISNDFEREFLRLSLQDVLTTTSAKILGARVTELKKLVVRCQKQPETPTPPEGLGGSFDSPRRPVRSPSPSSPEYNKLISDATELMLLRPDEIDELSLVLFEESIPDNLNRAHLQSIAIEIRDIQRGYELSFRPIIDFTKCLLKFLEDHRGATKTLAHLINYYNTTVTDVSPELQKPKIVWRLINALVMFSPTEQPSGTATGLMHAFGQRFPQGNEYLPFTDTFNITDLVKTKFDIVPTTFLSQHLVVEGNVVKISELSTISDLALTVYDQNRVARMLQLSSLGNEVIASLAQLVDGHGLQEQGEKLGFISYDAKNKGRRLVGSMLLTHFIHNHKTVKPNLLAGRLVHLNNLVKRRKRWWVSLGYNIAQQKSDQPFIFAVTILGILFGVSSIVQTVFSA